MAGKNANARKELLISAGFAALFSRFSDCFDLGQAAHAAVAVFCVGALCTFLFTVRTVSHSDLCTSNIHCCAHPTNFKICL